ncbi:MAG TPA: ABC transporter substrate-binding protein, partial [Arthrobacter sp.]|nr:ABC transporter substrate-binding protein [Arthrobacter sp.]
MSHPIDVGSVLGGRYKVTATVLTSHDQDLVLDGVDQVLNRAVSILVAGPDNADQVAQSAREVATGERPGHV